MHTEEHVENAIDPIILLARAVLNHNVSRKISEFDNSSAYQYISRHHLGNKRRDIRLDIRNQG